MHLEKRCFAGSAEGGRMKQERVETKSEEKRSAADGNTEQKKKNEESDRRHRSTRSG